MKQHFLLLHYLRGAAALMVLAFHGASNMCGRACSYDALANLGVDLFFVISGFVMWASTSGRNITPTEFYTRRFFRVAPLYYLMTVFVSLVALVTPQLLRTAMFDFRHFLDSLLFLPSRMPRTGQVLPVVVPGWTLNYEMFFYILFATCLALPGKARFPGIIASIVALVLAGMIYKPDGLVTQFYTSQIMLEFAYGITIAWVLEVLGRKSLQVLINVFSLLVIGEIAILANILPALNTQMTFGIISAIAVWTVCELDARFDVVRIGILKWIGDASFSIYLLQMATISAGVFFWKAVGMPIESKMIMPFVVFVTAITFACSYFTYWLVELPMQRIGTRLAKKIGDWERNQMKTDRIGHAVNGQSEQTKLYR